MERFRSMDLRQRHFGRTTASTDAMAAAVLDDPSVQLFGRLMRGSLNDHPVSSAAARDLLAAVLGLDSPDKLRDLSSDEVSEALHRLMGLTRRLTAAAATDDLTGAMRRGAGILAVRREIERSRRTGSSLVIAVADVDGLKAINDGRGHPAGDDVLRAVVGSLRRHFRAYDLVLRYGGDEFVCALPNADVTSAQARFAAVRRTLANATGGYGRISVGVAELTGGDTLDGLIARADADLYVQRRRRRGDQATSG